MRSKSFMNLHECAYVLLCMCEMYRTVLKISFKCEWEVTRKKTFFFYFHLILEYMNGQKNRTIRWHFTRKKNILPNVWLILRRTNRLRSKATYRAVHDVNCEFIVSAKMISFVFYLYFFFFLDKDIKFFSSSVPIMITFTF